MPLTLVSSDGSHRFTLREGVTLVLGRAPTCDLPIVDPTISRRHAELRNEGGTVLVRDLGSSNGTLRDGVAVETTSLVDGDAITFGKIDFRVEFFPPTGRTPVVGVGGGTIVRQIPVRGTGIGPGVMVPTSPLGHQTVPSTDRDQLKLWTLLEVSKGLGRSAGLDALLEKIVRYAGQILEIDRAAILLLDENDALVPRIARDSKGDESTRPVPQSIARTAVTERVAILSDDAGEDVRFGGQSVVAQQIRSAICCPLIGSEHRVMGVLYVDNVSTTHRFTDDDLEYCIAFAGLAAVAIENEQFAQRIQREALVRSNFERFFAPALAERIASSPNAMRLGGEKRTVSVLFSDIRGFTPLSESMRPDEMATLLTEYFTEMVECVFRNGGVLDKFIGDAVMAEWGAPLPDERSADNALRAAMDMQEALERLNARWRDEGRPELRIGIGINHGEAFAGNIGSERRLEFTIIGDVVNTANRLCDVAAPGEILVSEHLLRALQDPPRVIECPPVALPGKLQSVGVYRVAL